MSSPTVGRPVAPTVSTPVAALLDAVAIVVFAALGRMSHAEGMTVAGVAGTAWPFLAGLVLGWVVSYVLLSRAPTDSSGAVLVWVGTIAGGMLLRAMTGQGVATSFIAVASIVTGVLLFGWRAIAGALARRRRA